MWKLRSSFIISEYGNNALAYPTVSGADNKNNQNMLVCRRMEMAVKVQPASVKLSACGFHHLLPLL